MHLDKTVMINTKHGLDVPRDSDQCVVCMCVCVCIYRHYRVYRLYLSWG